MADIFPKSFECKSMAPCSLPTFFWVVKTPFLEIWRLANKDEEMTQSLAGWWFYLLNISDIKVQLMWLFSQALGAAYADKGV